MNSEQLSILKHADKQVKGAYCGPKDCPDMNGLVEMSLMKGPFKAGFIPESEAYFYITRDGRRRANEDGK